MKLLHEYGCWNLAFTCNKRPFVFVAHSGFKTRKTDSPEVGNQIGMRYIGKSSDGTLVFKAENEFKPINIVSCRPKSQNFRIVAGDTVLYNPSKELFEVYGDDESRRDSFMEIKQDCSGWRNPMPIGYSDEFGKY